ncbi:MAG: tRNA lysidine(34) synthetase TilS [Blautia sp.]|nr:tRNA lysidine(34) synthetase TilS [Blautia sp.]
MEKKTAEFIREQNMIEEGDVVLAGVSGGSDSMAMLGILKSLRERFKFSLCAVHVHHGIRGPEADRDGNFVREICSQWGIPCRIFHYDVPKLSREWKKGEEETGRIVRREAFEKAASEYTWQRRVRIALAHNREDLAETMIHNLCRGTGLRGLCTMRPVSGEIIRPVLCLGRDEIVHYLEENHIPHIQDSTNDSDFYTRNRIRHHILPLLQQEINSRAASHMAETAFRLAQAEDYLSEQGKNLSEEFYQGEEGYFFTEKFADKPQILQKYALQQAVDQLAGRRKDITAVHIENVLKLFSMPTSRQISLPYHLLARRDYTGVRLYREEKSVKPCASEDLEWEMTVPGITVCSYGEFRTEIILYKGQKIEEKKYTKWLDYDKIEKTPCIRTRRSGDYMVINSSGGTKKLNRCMIDRKIPADRRDQIPLVVCDRDVLWMVGDRISERYKITPETRRVLVLEYQGGYGNE